MGTPPKRQPTGVTAKSTQPQEKQWSDTEHDEIARLASALAAHGGGTLSPDLVLDLVLNEVVKHACLVTGASAAAIALVRENEMVCRATTGTEAPDLGVRLDTRTGLSGACVLTREVQHCDDTESDPRVNLEVSRRLGVRSVLVVPLIKDEELVGIFEIFSPTPNHFGDPDISSVKSLADEVIQNLKKASGPATEAQVPVEQASLAAESAAEVEQADPRVEVVASEPDNEPDEAMEARLRANEWWTAALSVIVIATAIFLGVLVGWRMGWRKAAPRGARQLKSASVKATPPQLTQGASAAGQPAGGGNPRTSSATTNAETPREGSTASGVSKAQTASVAKAAAPPAAGGLVVYQNGKVIYRMVAPTRAWDGPPIQQPARSSQVTHEAAGTSDEVQQVSEDAAAARILRRVDPEYPAEARQNGLQGPVVLDANINREGNVQHLRVLSGDPVLANAAMQAVKQWRYQPFYANGRTVEVHATITVVFTLPGN